MADPRRDTAKTSPAREELVGILEHFEAVCRRLRKWYDSIDDRSDAAVLVEDLDEDAQQWRETIQSLAHLPQLLVTDLQSEWLLQRDLTIEEMKALFEGEESRRGQKGGAL